MSEEAIGVDIGTRSTRYDEADEAFLREVAALRDALRREGVQIVGADGGGKGPDTVSTVVQTVVYGGSGLTAVLATVRFWLRQRGDRRVRLTVRRPGEPETTVELDGTNVTEDALLTALTKSLADGER